MRRTVSSTALDEVACHIERCYAREPFDADAAARFTVLFVDRVDACVD